MEQENSSSVQFNHHDSPLIPKNLKNFMREDSEPLNNPNSQEIYYLDSKENVSQFLRDHSENRQDRSIFSLHPNRNAYDAIILYQPKPKWQQKKMRDLVDPSYLVKQEALESEFQESNQPLIKIEEAGLIENTVYFEERQQIENFHSMYQFLQSSYQLLQRYIFQRSKLPLFTVPFDFNCEDHTVQNQTVQIIESQFQNRKQAYSKAGYRQQFVQRFGVDLISSLEKQEKPHQKSLQLLISVRNNLKIIENQINYLNKDFKKKFQLPFSTCRICNEKFESGRQLGGHMSRKHPGRSRQYRIKKQVREAKQCDRKRKNFFKSNYPYFKTKRVKDGP